MDKRNDNLIVNKTEAFAVKIISFHQKIKTAGIESMAVQLFRSGTAIGANVREAQNSESKKDFIHKMKLAAKEADETEYWLNLCRKSELLPDPGELENEIESISKILNKIIASSKRTMVQ